MGMECCASWIKIFTDSDESAYRNLEKNPEEKIKFSEAALSIKESSGTGA